MVPSWHGINPCYLLTFILGGFYQSIGRSFRKLLRPFFLPPAFSPTAVKPLVAAATSTPVASAIPHRPSFIPPPQTPLKWAYDIAGIVATQAAINFTVVPFCVLDVRRSLQAWGAVGFYGIWFVVVPMLALNLGAGKFLGKQLKARDAKYAKSVSREERKMDEERIAWEKKQEAKRVQRGEGVASIGPDVEELVGDDLKGPKVPEKEL